MPLHRSSMLKGGVSWLIIHNQWWSHHLNAELFCGPESSWPSLSAFFPFKTGRSSLPSFLLAAAVQTSMPFFAQIGTATVRTRLPFPSRSTSTHHPSRCRMFSNLSSASSVRRRAHPTNSCRITVGVRAKPWLTVWAREWWDSNDDWPAHRRPYRVEWELSPDGREQFFGPLEKQERAYLEKIWEAPRREEKGRSIGK